MMQRIGLFYASTTGNTEAVAERIAAMIEEVPVDLYDLAVEPVSRISEYERLILGISTWDFGELQEDWDMAWSELEKLDLHGHQVALFGLGDQLGYSEWFLDAMGLLGELIRARGGELVAPWPVEGYLFEQSRALNAEGSHFVGLAIDEDGQADQTEERITRWVPEVLRAFGV